MNPQELYYFWFGSGSLTDPAYIGSRMSLWFGKDDQIDADVRIKFSGWLDRYPSRVFDPWKKRPRDLLALVLLLDQVPRNSFRETGRAFAYDPAARNLTREALQNGFDQQFTPFENLFLLLPLEHSENVDDQRESVRRLTDLHDKAPENLKKLLAGTADYARRHCEVIASFGRFPHRNHALGRESTPAEIEFLKQPGSGF